MTRIGTIEQRGVTPGGKGTGSDNRVISPFLPKKGGGRIAGRQLLWGMIFMVGNGLAGADSPTWRLPEGDDAIFLSALDDSAAGPLEISEPDASSNPGGVPLAESLPLDGQSAFSAELPSGEPSGAEFSSEPLSPQNGDENLQPESAPPGTLEPGTLEPGTSESEPLKPGEPESAEPEIRGDREPPSDSEFQEDSESEPSPPVEEGEGIELIKKLIQVPDAASSGIRGEELSLSDLLNGVNQPAVRRRITEAYWDLSGKLALYQLSLIHANDVEDCVARFLKSGTVSQNETAILLSARRVAAQGVKEAEIQFLEEQYRFAEIDAKDSSARSNPRSGGNYSVPAKRPISIRLSIPTEVPTTAPYITRYDKIKKERSVSAEAEYFNDAIPIQYEAVKAYETAVNETFEAYKTLYFSSSGSAELLLTAADRHAEAKERLLRAVIDYNRLIAAYVSETVGGNVRGNLLLTTMIRLPENQGAPASSAPELAAASKGRVQRSGGVIPISSVISKDSERSGGRPVSAIAPFVPTERRSVPAPKTGTGAPMSPEPPKGEVRPDHGRNLIIRGQLSELSGPFGSDSPYPESGGTGPSVMPPGTESEEDMTLDPIFGAAPSSGDSAAASPANPPTAEVSSGGESEKSDDSQAKRGGVSPPRSLDLTPEQGEKLWAITSALFPVAANKSGAGDSEIVEIPLSLHDALSRTSGGEPRLLAVESYWSLRRLIAALHLERQIKESASAMLAALLSSGVEESPEFQALTATWRSYLASSDARMAELKVTIRGEQVNLMSLCGRSTDQGWPIPSSFPWFENYRLESDSAKDQNFRLIAESVLIPEKILAVYADGFALGEVETLFKPEMTSFERMDDGYLYLKTLENKRLAALGYMRILESLNNSIARYVNAFSSTLDAKRFADCLIGEED